MLNSYNRLVITLTVLTCLLISCGQGPLPPEGIAAAVTERVEVPVTVEVTRVVTQQVVVEMTPLPPQPCAPTSAEAASEIIVGGLVPLSKPGAMLAGFAMQAAMNLAIDDVNDAGGIRGKPLRLLTYDTAGNAERTAQFAQRLITQDCAVALVGFYHDAEADAGVEIAHRFGIPVIITEARADALTARGYPEVFRIAPTQTMVAAMPMQLYRWAGDYNQDGILSGVIIVDSAAVANGAVELVRSQLSRGEVQAEIVPVDLPSSDFSSAIARIVTMDRLPDAVFVFVSGDASLTIINQLVAAGITPQRNTLIVTGQTALDSTRFWERVPEGRGVIAGRVGPWKSLVSPVGLEFAAEYSALFGRWPEPYAFASYDGVRLLAAAMQNADSLASASLVESLAAIDVELAAGRYTFPYGSKNPPDGNEVAASLWQQWPNPPLLYLQYSETGQAAENMSILLPEAMLDGASAPAASVP